MRKKLIVCLLTGIIAVSAMACGPAADDTEKSAGQEPAIQEETAEAPEPEAPAPEITVPEGYHLVWNDEFDGDELNDDDWNYEVHEAGWVNNELQEYIADPQYAYVKDGELVIQPVKTEKDGKVSYASGRVNTQNKHDYKYGRFEARIRVPEGKGFLPAFWMMPQDEDHYGQWPKCGEIDIMEVLGDSTKNNYGTVHYGEPHEQQQGMFALTDGGDFSKEYHEFAVEWEPGQIRWYVDGEQYFETSTWFTKVEGEEEKPYPAPFNQPFHVILNVAVGGDWPGSPDDTTVFDERASMRVDYVRIFQKDSYDENVEKPVEVLDMREPDETGNYVRNSSFAEDEDLGDDTDWKFLLFNGGEGAASIQDGEIVITSTKAGTAEYSVQLVQPEMPMVKGKSYKFSFEAYAEEDRKMKAAVTAPDVNWIRYFPDTSVELGPDWKTYEFEVKDEDDDNGRVEFNMGSQGSTATIHIRNVRLEQTD
ncbi:MAG: family 16 glycosylhydrolase [Lachnospiraceae bacterium]|nr:family 16 glycosylhydrolase [Lachnospiraceae bacterium]